MRTGPLSLQPCRYGQMLFFPEDEVIGRSLRLYGEWAEHELQCLRPYLPDTGLILDVGAHLGTHALAFARWSPGARVLAFEAQPDVAAVLRVNALLNGLTNIEVHEVACAAHDGWCAAATAPADNLGGASFLPVARPPPWWHWRRPTQPPGAVRLTKLDTWLAGRSGVGFVKMDIEDMEVFAVRGGLQTLRRDRPILFLEQRSTDTLPALFELLLPLGYNMFWLETQPFNQANFRAEAENVWWRTEMGLLALPPGRAPISPLPMAQTTDKSLPDVLDARLGWSGT